jgi:hypothetical protein
MNKSQRLSPYALLEDDERVMIAVFIDKELYRQLRSTCLSHGDAADYLAFFFSKLTTTLDQNELTTTHHFDSEDRVRSIVTGIVFTRPNGDSQTEGHVGRTTKPTHQEVRCEQSIAACREERACDFK